MVAAACGRKPCLWPFPPLLIAVGGALVGRGAAADSLVGSYIADEGAFRTQLGWRPPVTLDAAIAATVAPR